MYKFIFTKAGEKEFSKLSYNNRYRIIRKLNELKHTNNIFFYIKKLENFLPSTHRLRVGDLRIILEFDLQKNTFYINDIGKRGDIYK